MADSYTTLNPGTSGDNMDEESVTFGSSPTTRKRPRVEIAGNGATEIARVQATAPDGTEQALVVRPIPSGTQDVAVASLPLPSGAATQTTLALVASNVAALTKPSDTQAVSAASLPLPIGAASLAKQPALGTAGTASADVITVQGIASMTALKTDASATTQPVSSTTLATAAKQPALGTAGTASADVLSVQGIASMTPLKVDGSAVTQPTKETRSSTGSAANVSSSATNVTLLSANASRLGATVFNDSAQVLYVKLGATASATSFAVKINAGGYYEVPYNYTGIIDGIWASADGAARIVEMT